MCFAFYCVHSVFLHCFHIVRIVYTFVYSCPSLIFVPVYRPLPPGRNPIVVNKYHIVSYQKKVRRSLVKSELRSVLQSVTNPSRDFKRRIWPTDYERRFNSIAYEACGSYVMYWAQSAYCYTARQIQFCLPHAPQYPTARYINITGSQSSVHMHTMSHISSRV